MSRPGASRAALAALVAVGMLVAGCSGVPDRGPVRAGGAEQAGSSSAPYDFNPPGPAPAATREEVVAGFLRALQANPVSTRVAREYLTEETADQWQPDRRTIVYDGQRTTAPASPTSGRVAVRLENSFTLDGTGRWTGSRQGTRTLQLRLVQEDEEWRIAGLPDALVIPQAHFEARYRRYSLYFFDVSGSVLVPSPVYLPWGPQTPTELVNGLLDGPSSGRRAVERSYLPRDATLSVSVPVGTDGTATVPLDGSVAELDEGQLERATAQLAWTLRQVEEVRSVEVTADDAAVELPGSGNPVDVGEWTEFSPTVASASTDLFGLRRRVVLQLAGDTVVRAAQVPPGTEPRSVGVDMTGRRFALVGDDGVVRVVPRATEEEPVTTVYDGTDVLRPMWDRTERLWLVDRTATGARVVVVGENGVRRLPAPGLAGLDVAQAALSRDGTRLVALVRRPGLRGLELVVSGVVRMEGRPVRLTQAVALPAARPLVGATGLAWRDPTTVAVLTRPSDTSSEVVLVSVDGSTGRIPGEESVDVLFDEGLTLAGSPGGPLALVVGAPRGVLHTLDDDGRWDLGTGPVPLRAPTFVG
ncbi:LpqB family beta-propeller domain-containing protein [Nocardioides caldifontis]|uniref:LpqB family beta-propeller domain-containing protein n=1 Tax=Nocardioides caldifontis TaxID=2588938 RepID=UPI0011DF8AEC|nr:LpqB family beta-propeller domain-containing protein [Nocardioides caldifontis]